jgi:hypothetical protein
MYKSQRRTTTFILSCLYSCFKLLFFLVFYLINSQRERGHLEDLGVDEDNIKTDL